MQYNVALRYYCFALIQIYSTIQVRSRIMVDRTTFSYLNPIHRVTGTVESAQGFRDATPNVDLDDDEILLTPTLVFGVQPGRSHMVYVIAVFA